MRHVVLLLVLVQASLSGCGGRAYTYEPIESSNLVARAETKTEGSIRVVASVPSEAETVAIFGVPLYRQGIQPVWLQVENGGDQLLRYAPVGTDRFYFSPLEVAWKNRSGYSKTGKQDMERRFDDLSMPRYIAPGELRSGFVFTNARRGIKGFNVDLFAPGELYNFTFLLRVPGFEPDYGNIDFASMYPESQVTDYDEAGLRAAIGDLLCCSSNASGNEQAGPINVVLIAKGIDLLYALLRANWLETSADDKKQSGSFYYFGREQDATFVYGSAVDGSRYEIRLWMAPMRIDGTPVWAGQLRRIINHKWIIASPDPDVDSARGFLLQNLWYSQTLKKYGWVAGEAFVAAENWWQSFSFNKFFSDGYRGAFWISAEPLSLLDTASADWDTLPLE